MIKKYKILNLYACLGGNRAKWDEVAKEKGIKIEVTAIELDEEAAILYQERFPNDIVIVTDAHQYLLDHYKEFDFIWSSPPCPSHSRARNYNTKYKAIYPDMKLYEEIILLETSIPKSFTSSLISSVNVVECFTILKTIKAFFSHSKSFNWSIVLLTDKVSKMPALIGTMIISDICNNSFAPSNRYGGVSTNAKSYCKSLAV